MQGTDVRALAYEFAESQRIPHHFDHEKRMAGPDWLKSFLRRNTDLSIRKAETLSLARARGLTRSTVDAFYDLLESEITKYNLHDKPRNIGNVDESGLQMINSPGRVIAQKGSKVVHKITTGEKGETVTLVAACTAEGRFFPPTLILKGKNLKPEFQDGLPPGSKVFMNPKSAYINSELFVKWFEEIYLPLKASGRNILILDGHCSHSSSISLLELAEKHDVSLLCLPPHTTHALQPLDRSFFKPLKTYFNTEIGTWVTNHPGRKVTRYQIGPLICAAWNRAATVGNCTSGFQATGIFPLNRHIIPDYFFDVSDHNRPTIATPDDRQFPGPSSTTVDKEVFDSSHDDNDDESITQNELDESPSKVLNCITPVPTLETPLNSRRTSKSAVLLTSPRFMKNVKDKMANKVEKEVKKNALTRKRLLSQLGAANSSTEESCSDWENDAKKAKKKKKIVKSGAKKTTTPIKKVGKLNKCKECKKKYDVKEKDWFRCHSCNKWLHLKCTIFEDSCIDCGRKSKK